MKAEDIVEISNTEDLTAKVSALVARRHKIVIVNKKLHLQPNNTNLNRLICDFSKSKIHTNTYLRSRIATDMKRNIATNYEDLEADRLHLLPITMKEDIAAADIITTHLPLQEKIGPIQDGIAETSFILGFK